MAAQTLNDRITSAILGALVETFENSQGRYLDQGTSLFETLATITAEEASRPVSSTCATIAAHVEHISFYIEALLRYVQGNHERVDWAEIWRRVHAVTPEEWAASQQKLRAALESVRALVNSMPDWEGDNVIDGALALLMHNAYHLGEIRHALCTVKAERESTPG